MNSDPMQTHNSVETLPEQLKRIYNLQNGSNDVSIRGSVFEDGDGAGNGSLHSREWQQPMDRRELGSSSNNWIRLNVGGKVFQTTRDTLMKVPGSFLYRLCQDDKRLPSIKDETGAYLIDRDADYFSPVLNYLRHGRLIINPGLADEGVLEEAEFYNLPQLVHLVNERIHEKERNASDAGRFKSVYRVIQCHEEELTTFISATSDGWKIVQITKFFKQGPLFAKGCFGMIALGIFYLQLSLLKNLASSCIILQVIEEIHPSDVIELALSAR
ncbi:K+ channel tetramerization domain protein [Necator americanus]|uniref:K+ channel tetramerization domain protein n=1 Tax=Necator americanus TaxID=51031 RepID=W2TP00_NECAM|nr:K+ channel tetramerization domain protein [Necator americanus]ETN82732.1 K+ channel tetramerization domain protein [Necator americanus]